MNWASSETITVLLFLLPGFVASTVFQSLTAHAKPRDFERVIQALVFTAVAQAFALGVMALCGLGDRAVWLFALSVPIAILLALLLAYWTNNDSLHRVLRRWSISRETPYGTAWYFSFANNEKSYVVLHLQGERRLYGWAEEWPSRPESGYFRMLEGEWLEDESDDQSQPRQKEGASRGVSDTHDSVVPDSPETAGSTILVPASAVELVEFVPDSSATAKE